MDRSLSTRRCQDFASSIATVPCFVSTLPPSSKYRCGGSAAGTLRSQLRRASRRRMPSSSDPLLRRRSARQRHQPRHDLGAESWIHHGTRSTTAAGAASTARTENTTKQHSARPAARAARQSAAKDFEPTLRTSHSPKVAKIGSLAARRRPRGRVSTVAASQLAEVEVSLGFEPAPSQVETLRAGIASRLKVRLVRERVSGRARALVGDVCRLRRAGAARHGPGSRQRLSALFHHLQPSRRAGPNGVAVRRPVQAGEIFSILQAVRRGSVQHARLSPSPSHRRAPPTVSTSRRHTQLAGVAAYERQVRVEPAWRRGRCAHAASPRRRRWAPSCLALYQEDQFCQRSAMASTRCLMPLIACT